MKRPLYKSFLYAFRGFRAAFKAERNLKLHVISAVLAVGLGIYIGLTVVEWGLVVFAIGFMFAAELFNTAVEKLSDEVCGGKHSNGIGACKDISAAATLIAALTALVIGIVVLIIPFFQKVF